MGKGSISCTLQLNRVCIGMIFERVKKIIKSLPSFLHLLVATM